MQFSIGLVIIFKKNIKIELVINFQKMHHKSWYFRDQSSININQKHETRSWFDVLECSSRYYIIQNLLHWKWFDYWDSYLIFDLVTQDR